MEIALTLNDWIPALSSTSGFALLLWLSRNLITTRLTNSVKHEYDVKLKELETSLKKGEETFNAKIREKSYVQDKN